MENTNNKRVYLDYAATTPVRSEVIETMAQYFAVDFGNPSSIYSTGRNAKKALEESRQKIADSLHARNTEIFFVSGGSESDNWAIKGIAHAYKDKGMHIITSKIEHHAVLNACKSLEKQGWEITYLDVDHDGFVSLEQLENAIRTDTVLVSVMMANNEIGTIQPVEGISAICRKHKVLFHTDAVQALGSVPIDIEKIGADLISFSGHKIYAPKGIGILYIKRGVRISAMIDGGSQEKRKRAGTENIPYIAGLATAVELAQSDCAAYAERLLRLRNDFIDKVLISIPHVRLNGHRDLRLPGNANLSFEFIEGESLLLLLDSMGYECSSGSACTSGSLDPSHVLLAIGLPHEIAHGSLRVTFGRFSSEEDIQPLVDALIKIVSRLRDMSPLYDDFLNGRITEPHCMFTGDSSYCKATTGCSKREDQEE
ncbi:MAG: cysteine desulfurase NifS [Saccharofermentanales bacterium]